jgi:hypothetical protein
MKIIPFTGTHDDVDFDFHLLDFLKNIGGHVIAKENAFNSLGAQVLTRIFIHTKSSSIGETFLVFSLQILDIPTPEFSSVIKTKYGNRRNGLCGI